MQLGERVARMRSCTFAAVATTVFCHDSAPLLPARGFATFCCRPPVEYGLVHATDRRSAP